MLALSVLMGLASSASRTSLANAEMLLKAAQELQIEWATEGVRSDYRAASDELTIYEVDSGWWARQLYEANAALQAQHFAVAVENYQKLFQMLLDDGGASADVYKFYANSATAYIGNGDRSAGEWMIDAALSLKPDYEFGLNIKQRLHNGTYDGLITAGLALNGKGDTSEMSLMESSAGEYYQFLGMLGINYSSSGTQGGVLKQVRSYEKAGRNKPCPCGSRDSAGRPLKFKLYHGR